MSCPTNSAIGDGLSFKVPSSNRYTDTLRSSEAIKIYSSFIDKRTKRKSCNRLWHLMTDIIFISYVRYGGLVKDNDEMVKFPYNRINLDLGWIKNCKVGSCRCPAYLFSFCNYIINHGEGSKARDLQNLFQVSCSLRSCPL